MYVTFVIKVPHKKFDINRTINDRVRAETFHCSKLASKNWQNFGPEGPENFSELQSYPRGTTYKISEESIHICQSYERKLTMTEKRKKKKNKKKRKKTASIL